MPNILIFLLFVFFASSLPAAIIGDESFDQKFNDPYRGYQNEDVANREFPFLSQYSSKLLQSNIEDVQFSGDFVKIGNSYYSISNKGDYIFSKRNSIGSGYYLYDYSSRPNEIFILQFYSDGFETKKGLCLLDGKRLRFCGTQGYSGLQEFEFSYFNQWYIQFLATCDSSQNQFFSKSNRSCVTCPAGQSWDDESRKCFIDCTDKNKNKWGFPDGSCIDCSSSKNGDDVRKCYCSAIGSTWNPGVQLRQGDFFLGSCKDGSQFWYKIPGTPDSDDNKTKPDLNNPNPGGGSGGDSGGGSGGGNGGDSGGGNSGGGSGGGNNGGSQDNPNPNPGGGSGDNPDPKPNPNPGGGSGGGGNGDKDKDKDRDAKFNPGDFNYSDKKREYEDFKNRYGEALNKVLENFDGFKQGVDQFISNIQGKGLASADNQSKPTTCVKKYDIDFFGYKSSIEFDFCKVASSVSGAFYYIFYAFFFYCFLILIVKILLFAF